MDPQVEPVQNSNGKKDSASYQESPQALTKAGKDVGKPCNEAQNPNDRAHGVLLLSVKFELR